MNLRTPGPIPVPDDILEAMSGPMINHRGPEFADILNRTTDRVKRVFETQSYPRGNHGDGINTDLRSPSLLTERGPCG